MKDLWGRLLYGKGRCNRRWRKKREDEYVSLARKSLEYYIKEGKILEVPKI